MEPNERRRKEPIHHGSQATAIDSQPKVPWLFLQTSAEERIKVSVAKIHMLREPSNKSLVKTKTSKKLSWASKTWQPLSQRTGWNSIFFFKLCSSCVIPIFWLAHPPLSPGIPLTLGFLCAFPPPAFFSPFVKHHIYDVSNISLMILALFKVTQPSFFGGLPSYFEALWYPHLYFYRKSNT